MGDERDVTIAALATRLDEIDKRTEFAAHDIELVRAFREIGWSKIIGLLAMAAAHERVELAARALIQWGDPNGEDRPTPPGAGVPAGFVDAFRALRDALADTAVRRKGASK